MPDTGIVALGLFIIGLGLIVMRRGINHARLMRRLRELNTAPLASLPEGLTRTRGRLHVEAPVTAPLTGRQAAYYFVRASSIPEPGEKARQLGASKQWGLAAIGDQDHRVVLEPWTPLVASAHQDRRRFDDLERVPAELDPLFEELGIADKHLARIQPFEVTEYRLEHGDDLYVTGSLDRSKGFYRHKRKPYIVSAFDDVGYMQGLRNEFLVYASLPPMLLVAGAIVFFLGLA